VTAETALAAPTLGMSPSKDTTNEFTRPTDGKGWYGAGVNNTSRRLRVTVSVQCLPSSELKGAATVTQDFTVPGGNGASWTYLACPAGTRVYTGGAFWHKVGSGPDPALAWADWESGNTATFDAVGWYAREVNGWGNGSSSLVLTLDAQCLPTH
jgi:hypothetical protein